MRLKNEGSKSRRYEVIALTSHFGFRDLEIRSRSLNVELDFQISVIHMRYNTWRPQVKALWSYRAYKTFWFAWDGDLEIRSRSLNVELDLQINVIHMSWKKWRYQVKALWSYRACKHLHRPSARRPLRITIPHSLDGWRVKMAQAITVRMLWDFI